MKQINTYDIDKLPKNAGFSEVWVHGYIMAWMIIFLMFTSFLGFFASSVLVITSGALLARKIEKGFEKTTVRVFTELNFDIVKNIEIAEVVERKLELCDIISENNDFDGLSSLQTAQNR